MQDQGTQRGLVSLGHVIRQERRRRGWTLRELAARSGLHHETIARIERGRDPSLRALRLISRAMDMSVIDLLGRADDV